MDSDGESNPIAHERNEMQSVAVESDNAYAAFVTYVQIYNNSVHDLLDEDDVRTRQVYCVRKNIFAILLYASNFFISLIYTCVDHRRLKLLERMATRICTYTPSRKLK